MPTVLITGGHTGIGFECAKQLAGMYHLDLVLAGRNVEIIEGAARELRAAYGVQVHVIELDTASLVSVRQAASQCRALVKQGAIDVLQALVCNAGAQFHGPISYSPDGYERTFATNFLGHYLLVELLFDLIAAQGRVVFTASGTHDPETTDGKMVGKAVEPDAVALANDGKDGATALTPGVRYSTSKLCTIMHAYELDRRLRREGSSVLSIAFDPGSVPETGLLREMPAAVRWLAKTGAMKWMMGRMGVTLGSIGVSGAGLAQVAADPVFADASGRYIQSKNGRIVRAESSKISNDKARAIKLWNDCKTLVALQPDEEPRQLQ